MSSTSPEYSTLLRLPHTTRPSPDHTYIPHTASLALRQLACDLTFARGRIVYEVWHTWTAALEGCIVPSAVASLAGAYIRNGLSASESLAKVKPLGRKGLRRESSVDLAELWNLVHCVFPRMPEWVGMRVAKQLDRSKRTGDGGRVAKREVEGKVVELVRWEWTSFAFGAGIATDDAVRIRRRSVWESAYDWSPARGGIGAGSRVEDAVKLRMRDVLLSWLPGDVHGRELEAFWRRHGLEDAVGVDDLAKEGSLRSGLMDYGGAETIANLVGKVPRGFA